MSSRIPLLLAAAALCIHGASAEPPVPPDEQGWTEVSNKTGLAIYCREKADSPVKEYKAIGIIAAPAWVVKNVIDDVDAYPAFMPYVSESRVLAREHGGIVTYQRLNTPFVSDRDYLLRISYETRRAGGGGVSYCNRWQAVEGFSQPARPGIVRVKINEGSWLLEPDGPNTRATYSLYTNPGGAIPAPVINYANKNAIPKLFAAIQKQAGEKKYRQAKPADY